MDIYFILAQVFQIALIVLLVIAWKRQPPEDAPKTDAPAPKPDGESKPL